MGVILMRMMYVCSVENCVILLKKWVFRGCVLCVVFVVEDDGLLWLNDLCLLNYL